MEVLQHIYIHHEATTINNLWIFMYNFFFFFFFFFYTAECEAMISGLLNSEGTVPWLSILETNGTHPAVVRCQVTCLDQQEFYNYIPAMALIITSQERFIRVSGPYTRDGFIYETRYGNIN